MAATTVPSESQPSEETQVGNYFISNYPPYSCWTQAHVTEARDALKRSPNPGTSLGLYFHVPFCRKRCHFCYFKVYTGKNAAQIKRYLDAGLRELELYAAQPFIGSRKPRFVYFGGGTPSYLGSDQLRYLSDRMKALLPWDEAEEVTFECEPGTLTEAKLKTIRAIGVTRLSLGVENFDDAILETNGRAHHAKEIFRAYGFARAEGFKQINIDLLAGMVGETEANWKDGVRKAIEMAPDSINIYQMEVPHNTTLYREMKTRGDAAAPAAGWPVKRRWVKHAFAELERAGYTVTSAYTAVKDPERTRFVYRDELWAGADLIGSGVASFGHVSGIHVQNRTEFDPYLADLEQGVLPLWRALKPSAEELFIREWVLQLKLGRARLPYFREKFGVDVKARFAEPFAKLRAQGFLKIVDETVCLSRDGLLQVDGLLPAFFLPKHRHVRYT